MTFFTPKSHLRRSKRFVFGEFNISLAWFYILIIYFMASCRKDEAIREANANDVVNGNFFSFSTAAELKLLSLAATDQLPTLKDLKQ